MKKIAFLLVDLGGGGGERVMLNLANAFAESGVPTDLILLEKRGAFVKEISGKLNVVECKTGRMLAALPRLIGYLRREKPQAVVATSIHMQVLLMLARLIAFSRTRIVLRIGIPLSERFKTLVSPRDRIVARLARVLFPKASALVPNSHGIAKDSAAALKMPVEKFSVIYNPACISIIKEKASEPQTHPWLEEKTTPIIVATGRLRPQKDFPTLIRALARTATNARLILLGAGDELERLKQVARECKVGNRIDFMGFVDNPYVYMSRADVFVLSSLYEGFPNALLEAMACGVLVVATDCNSGPRELLAPDTDPHSCVKGNFEKAAYGVLVPPKDPRMLATAIDMLIGDADLHRYYAEKSTERSQDFDITKILAQYKRVLYDE